MYPTVWIERGGRKVAREAAWTTLVNAADPDPSDPLGECRLYRQKSDGSRLTDEDMEAMYATASTQRYVTRFIPLGILSVLRLRNPALMSAASRLRSYPIKSAIVWSSTAID